MGQVDEGLEEMLIEFQVDPARAEAAAKKQTFSQFSKKLIRLESEIGTDAAYAVITKGSSIEGDSFIDYTNSEFEKYLVSVKEVAEILKDEIVKKDSGGWYARFFYSIESLDKFIKEKNEIGLGGLRDDSALRKFYLFHPDNEQSKEYLDLLIRKGEVIVRDSEHWRKSGRTNGPRGNNILKKIIFELTSSFGEIENLEKPNYDVNYGQNKLTVDAGTQKNLRLIRDMAYNP